MRVSHVIKLGRSYNEQNHINDSILREADKINTINKSKILPNYQD